MYVCMYVCMQECMYIYICMYIYMYVYVCIYVCMHVYIYMYVCMYVVHMYVCVYIYVWYLYGLLNIIAYIKIIHSIPSNTTVSISMDTIVGSDTPHRRSANEYSFPISATKEKHESRECMILKIMANSD